MSETQIESSDWWIVAHLFKFEITKDKVVQIDGNLMPVPSIFGPFMDRKGAEAFARALGVKIKPCQFKDRARETAVRHAASLVFDN